MSPSGQRTRLGSGDNDGMGIIARLSRAVSDSLITNATKSAANDAAYVTKKLLKSTGKAAWYAGITFLVLIVPIFIEMDREQQLSDLEFQQQSLLGSPPPLSAPQ